MIYLFYIGFLYKRKAGKMKKIAALIFLLLPVLLFAQPSATDSGHMYTENGFFTITIPAGWGVYKNTIGLSQEEKKVYGADFMGPADQNGIAAEISVFYYAPDNLLCKTAERYIDSHLNPVLGSTSSDSVVFDTAKIGHVGEYLSKVFDRFTFTYLSRESISPPKFRVYEKFNVISAISGFYVLKYYSSTAAVEKYLPLYEAALTTFKPVLDCPMNKPDSR
jgi:hypothetical protein